jgi:NAD(P)H-nitrite reductase large subunit
VDLFGAQKADLPSIWKELIDAGFESGHGYGKALRTVKSCVGTNWCRYGIGDSVGCKHNIHAFAYYEFSTHSILSGDCFGGEV